MADRWFAALRQWSPTHWFRGIERCKGSRAARISTLSDEDLDGVAGGGLLNTMRQDAGQVGHTFDSTVDQGSSTAQNAGSDVGNALQLPFHNPGHGLLSQQHGLQSIDQEQHGHGAADPSKGLGSDAGRQWAEDDEKTIDAKMKGEHQGKADEELLEKVEKKVDSFMKEHDDFKSDISLQKDALELIELIEEPSGLTNEEALRLKGRQLRRESHRLF